MPSGDRENCPLRSPTAVLEASLILPRLREKSGKTARDAVFPTHPLQLEQQLQGELNLSDELLTVEVIVPNVLAIRN